MAEYIEREAVLDYIDHMPSELTHDGRRMIRRIRLTEYITDSIPATDVAPVRHGRWIGNKRHQSCSECHMTYCVPDGQDGELDMTSYHFCPNCGADMREES